MKYLFALALIVIYSNVYSQFDPNYDESKIPPYTLPELLVSQSGDEIKSLEDWENVRREELLNLFESEVYGKVPETDIRVSYKIEDLEENALNGIAIRKQVSITLSNNQQSVAANLLIYLPKNLKEPAPLFIGYNFYGNHTIHPDNDIFLTESWCMNNPNVDIFNNTANELSRGFRTNRWPVSYILSKGYGLAVMYYGEIDPDYDDKFQNRIHPLFYNEGQSKPAPDEWGSISAWAFGLIKAMDYFEQDKQINHEKIAVIGHSRLGKTSLWAGALDKRFALVISNESGCGGAALSMRRIGETIGRINQAFPHWFCDNFNKYNDNEDQLPVDQHMLIALMAPRPVYIASAKGDSWADPKGEFLSGFYASKVYELYELKGLDESFPSSNSPLKDGSIGYHIRTGSHDLTYYDWKQFIEFADIHIK